AHFCSIKTAGRQNSHSDNAVAFGVEWVWAIRRTDVDVRRYFRQSENVQSGSVKEDLALRWKHAPRGIVEAESQVGEAGIFELIVNPCDIEAEGAAETPRLGSRHLKCLPRATGRS